MIKFIYHFLMQIQSLKMLLTHLWRIGSFYDILKNLSSSAILTDSMGIFRQFYLSFRLAAFFVYSFSTYTHKACNFIKKETLAWVFSCEPCEISKNTFFYRTPMVASADNSCWYFIWNFPISQFKHIIWVKVFKKADHKVHWGSLALGRPYHIKYFKSSLPQILLGPFLNTLTHLWP